MPTVSVATNSDLPEEFQEVEIELSQTIYDECEKNGLHLPHGCLAGSCGSCRIEVIEGAEHLKPASPIEQNTIDALKEEMLSKYGPEYLEGKEIRLSCRARIIHDSKVKIRAIK